jgi:hypothetical protein
MKRIIEEMNLVSGFLPVDMSAGANAGDWVSLKGYGSVAVVFFKNAGTAADDPTVTIEQAQAVAGTNNKALNFTTIHTKQDTVLTAVTVWTKVTQAAANTYTDATSAEDAAIWVVEFDAADLDVAGGFDCIQASVGDVGNNAQVGCILYILSKTRYPQAITESAITD